MKYTQIDASGQVRMMEQRLAGYEQKHQEAALNISALEAELAVNPEKESVIEAAMDKERNTQKVLDAAHASLTAELRLLRASLPKDKPAANGNRATRRATK